MICIVWILIHGHGQKCKTPIIPVTVKLQTDVGSVIDLKLLSVCGI